MVPNYLYMGLVVGEHCCLFCLGSVISLHLVYVPVNTSRIGQSDFMQMILKLIPTVIDLSYNLTPYSWAFQLSLDPTARLDDMGFMKGIHQPCTIDFKTRVPETELMHMMLSWSRVEESPIRLLEAYSI